MDVAADQILEDVVAVEATPPLSQLSDPRPYLVRSRVYGDRPGCCQVTPGDKVVTRERRLGLLSGGSPAKKPRLHQTHVGRRSTDCDRGRERSTPHSRASLRSRHHSSDAEPPASRTGSPSADVRGESTIPATVWACPGPSLARYRLDRVVPLFTHRSPSAVSRTDVRRSRGGSTSLVRTAPTTPLGAVTPSAGGSGTRHAARRSGRRSGSPCVEACSGWPHGESARLR